METILCPTDFSPRSDRAIWYADELAQRMNSRIVLLHTIYEPVVQGFILSSGDRYGGLPSAPPIRDPDYWQEQQGKLEALKKELQNTNWGMPVAYDTKIKYGDTKDTIPQVAHDLQADLIVMGTAGTDGPKDLFAGSQVTEVISNAPCPVLIIPPKATFRPIYRMVFATDLEGEPFAEVAFVIKLAALFDSEIMFLHILADDHPYTRQGAQEAFDRLHKRLAYRNAAFITKTHPHIEAGISQFTSSYKADMLVMGYHPRNLWQHLFTQDYTQELAHHTTLPMLILHYYH
jgi:nucleotide-binding universal stress UspA family protein